MAVKTYFAKDVSIVISDRTITGFNSITIDPESDGFSSSVGADGEVSRSLSADRRANIELNMQQVAESNDFLSGLHNEDLETGNKTFNITIRDNRGKSLHEAAEAWIMKAPAAEYAAEEGERVWALQAANMINVIGGN